MGYPQETPNLRNIRPDFTTTRLGVHRRLCAEFHCTFVHFRFDFRRIGTRYITVDIGKRYPAAHRANREVFRRVH